MLVIVEVHPGESGEECLYSLGWNFEEVDKFCFEISGIKGGLQMKLGIIKYYAFELNNSVCNSLIPVLAAGLDHTIRKSVKGDIEDMPISQEVGSESAEHEVLLQQEYFAPEFCESVGGGHPGQT